MSSEFQLSVFTLSLRTSTKPFPRPPQTDPQATLKPSFLMMAALRGSLRELSERLEP
ncbi:MAG UNVERIFIED_CONTAM: hypothetical protein LVT10_20540 [Anaerolineae bacterium]